MRRVLILIQLFLIFTKATDVYYVKRAQWNSPIITPLTDQLLIPVQRVFIHHTNTKPCTNGYTCSQTVRRLQKVSVETGVSPDIRFNFLIGGDGRVYEGTGWYSTSNHITHYKHDIGIALIGNFRLQPPSKAQLQLTEVFITINVLQGKIKRNFGLFLHSDASCTSCPGSYLSDIIRQWPRYGHGGPVDRKC